MEDPLVILHFNDVYNVEPQKSEPAGGAARMAHYVKSQAHLKPLVLFSGDAVNPSLMSIFLKGEQMIPALNGIGVQCAVYGNHDFDFGVDHLEEFAEATNFPWLLSNIVDKINNEPLAKGKVKHMIDCNGTKVGIMGLVEEEWIDTLSTVDPEDIIFQDFVEVGNRLAAELRGEGADLVIALTHMRWPNDRKVAEMVPGVDIVLGGHDHDYGVEQVNGKYVVKSGTDFRDMSKITITRGQTGLKVDIEHVEFDSSVPEDEFVKSEVERLTVEIDKKMDEHLGNMGVPMDGRFSQVRTQETNLGNFVADIILEAVPADICLLNSGTLRSDRVHPKGEFSVRDLLTILPLLDPLIVIELSGKAVVKALENGVSQYPKLEGRFPQVAGVQFAFDPSKPAGQRVEPSLVRVQEEYIDMDKIYRLCTKEYVASGKDGYDVFKGCPVVVDSEQCPSISTAVRNHFESVQILNNEKPCRSGHRQSLCSIVRRTCLVHQTIRNFTSSSKLYMAAHTNKVNSTQMTITSQTTTVLQATPVLQATCAPVLRATPVSETSSVLVTAVEQEEDIDGDFRRESLVSDTSHIAMMAKVTHAYVRQMSIHDVELEQQHLCPRVDGRISRIDDKARERLLASRMPPPHVVIKEPIREGSTSESP